MSILKSILKGSSGNDKPIPRDWILLHGRWNDLGEWKDDGIWKDDPDAAKQIKNRTNKKGA